MTFPCTRCGACCQQPEAIGLPAKEDGSCLHLTDELLCSIYDTRPPICRVMDSCPTGVSEKQWVDFNAAACNLMVRRDGLGKEYLVQLGDREVPSVLEALKGVWA